MEAIIQIILYVGSVQGLLLSVFLISIRTNKISNRILGLLTFLWGIFLLTFALQEEGLYIKVPHLLKVFYQFLFLFFPLLYLMVKYLLARYQKFQWKDWIHFLPFVLSILFYSDFYLQSGETKIEIIRNRSEYYTILQIVGNEVVALQGVLYSIFSLILIAKYRKKIKDYESTVDKSMVPILFIGITLTLISWIIGITGNYLEYLNINTVVDIFSLAYLVLVMVIYVISYAAVKSPEIFKLDLQTVKEPIILTLTNQEKNTKEIKGEEKKETYLAHNDINEQLINYMETEKPFLEANLTLPELANLLDVQRNHLSAVINQVHKKNFYEFVNDYRVKEVKQLMTYPDNIHIKLISLAYDAGFNSKASFNRIFKQITGKTPSQFNSENKADKAG